MTEAHNITLTSIVNTYHYHYHIINIIIKLIIFIMAIYMIRLAVKHFPNLNVISRLRKSFTRTFNHHGTGNHIRFRGFRLTQHCFNSCLLFYSINCYMFRSYVTGCRQPSLGNHIFLFFFCFVLA
jgi:hypothetical protein